MPFKSVAASRVIWITTISSLEVTYSALNSSILSHLPSPLDVGAVRGINPKTEKEESRPPDPKGPLCALAFKTIADRHGDLTFLRIYSGILNAGEQVFNPRVGQAERINRIMVMHANERVQFGRPIGTFQAIKHKCADMMVAVESARSACYYAACVASEGSEELPVVASLAQVVASDAYFRCAADAIQIHGGVGFTWEYDLHMYFKRAKSSESFLGDPSYHRERVAQRIGV